MSFLDKGNKSGILAGIYLVNAVVAPLTIFYSVSDFELCVFDHWTNFWLLSGLLRTSEVPRNEPLPQLLSVARSLSETSSVPKHSKPVMPLISDRQSLLLWEPRPAVP